ncbi:MAG TPA: SDR family oxidoreductase, partial [Steroidobacteraceae bacterium]|nr:SDR family oxidoreductase [Steroidobacteraceae bacterium]
MAGRLNGKSAIVTGGAQGIGAAIVRRYLEEGARVALLDRSAEGIDAALVALPRGSAVAGFKCDVSIAADVDAFYRSAADWLGTPQIVVNNAGTAISGGLEEMSEGEWDHLFAVNVKSIYLVTRRAIPLMRAAGGGSVINMASESAFIGFPMHPAYCASKAAVVHLSRSMATRYAPDGIRVNALCPGTIDTPLFRKFLAQQPDPNATHAEILRMHPLGIGTPEDVAHAAVFLGSDESRYATG